MAKKQIYLGMLLVALVAFYLIFFSDWFKKQTLMIHHTSRPMGYAMRTRRNAPATLTFGLDHSSRLTEIKVVSLAQMQTNENPAPLWHLLSDSNSMPVENFRYGQNIRGMKPAVAGTRPVPLQTNVMYRLLVSAGKVKGSHDFEIK